jgi:hypothetical protein
MNKTAITCPEDLISAVPFILGYSPENSLVVIALDDDGGLNYSMRVDYPTADEFHDLGQVLITKMISEQADSVLIVAYSNDPIASECLMEFVDEIRGAGITAKELLLIANDRYRSLLCNDLECCPLEGNLVPDLKNSKVATERVFNGDLMPFDNIRALTNSLNSDAELVNNVEWIAKIASFSLDTNADDYSLQLVARSNDALDLIKNYLENKEVSYELAAKVLGASNDLQLRDFIMGLTTEDTIDALDDLYSWLFKIAPKGYLAPIGSILSSIAYELGSGALANKILDRVFDDQEEYPLGKLLKRVYSAGWPPASFASMRGELHHKVCATIYGEGEFRAL